jgi:FkbM family methyltransferase
MRPLRAAAGCYRVLRSGIYGGRGWRIVTGYLYLTLAALFERGGSAAKVRTRVAGWRITGWGYGALAGHFESKFIDREYQFATGAPRPFIVDCGANIGTAILFFKTLYPGAEIVAFEPDPAAFEALDANIRDNALRDVTIHRAAVGGGDAHAVLYVGASGTGQASLVAPLEPARPVTVDVVRLSRYIDRPVDLLKIDVEGAEMDVLTDLVETGTLSVVRQMVIEYHHHMTPADDRMSAVFRLLEDAGFGYVIAVPKRVAYRPTMYQDILVYAYRKSPTAAPAPS